MLFACEVLQSLLVSLTLATLGSAANTPDATATKTTSNPSTTTSTGIATHTIQVGPKSAPHAYVPHNITANPGDVVVFEFYPTNHSVVKADYLAPCVPASEGLFYSGAFDTFSEQDGQLVGPPPTWSLVVNDTEPTFFYCTAIGSCLQNGMVGVINPNSTETWQAQYNRALKYPYMLVPGQSMPAEGSTGSSTGSTATTTSTTSPTTRATTTAAASSGGHSLSGGVIAGIVVACVAFVAILVALFFVLGRNRVYRQWMSSEDGRTERTARWAMFNSPGGSTWKKGELDSNAAKAPPTDVTSIGSPDGTRSTFSPQVGGSASSAYASSPRQASGHWSWEAPHNVRTYRFPTELEANSAGPQISEMSDVREYR